MIDLGNGIWALTPTEKANMKVKGVYRKELKYWSGWQVKNGTSSKSFSDKKYGDPKKSWVKAKLWATDNNVLTPKKRGRPKSDKPPRIPSLHFDQRSMTQFDYTNNNQQRVKIGWICPVFARKHIGQVGQPLVTEDWSKVTCKKCLHSLIVHSSIFEKDQSVSRRLRRLINEARQRMKERFKIRKKIAKESRIANEMIAEYRKEQKKLVNENEQLS